MSRFSRLRSIGAALSLVALSLAAGWLLWPSQEPPLTPSPDDPRVLAILIPRGTARKIMAGEKAATLFPSQITLTAGVKDILMIRNEDEVGHGLGPFWINAGRTFTARFSTPGTYTMGCSLDPQHVFQIVVLKPPSPESEIESEIMAVNDS